MIFKWNEKKIETEKGKKMKIEYDKETDALYVFFRTVEVGKSNEVEEGVIVDFDSSGHIAGIEILDAGKCLSASDLVNVSIENLPVGIAV